MPPGATLGLLTALCANGYTIRRGVLDTMPASWPAGTPVWFLNEFSQGITNIERAMNERAEVRLLTNTAAGQRIRVTTAAGNAFDGDETSQKRMSRAINGMEPADMLM